MLEVYSYPRQQQGVAAKLLSGAKGRVIDREKKF
jgi:hypothetical protein